MRLVMTILRTVGAFVVMAAGVTFFAIGCANTQLGAMNMTRFILGGLLVAATGLLVLLTVE
jgi:hypothetical protein